MNPGLSDSKAQLQNPTTCTQPCLSMGQGEPVPPEELLSYLIISGWNTEIRWPGDGLGMSCSFYAGVKKEYFNLKETG